MHVNIIKQFSIRGKKCAVNLHCVNLVFKDRKEDRGSRQRRKENGQPFG
jgi:hypothetical protein